MPSMGEIVNSVKDRVTGLFGRGKSQESQDHLSNDVEASLATKRKATDYEAPSRSRKRQDRRSEEERRLQGDYDVPSDAVLISMPGAYRQAEEVKEVNVEETKKRMFNGKVGAGRGHRPMDTLKRRFASSPREGALDVKYPSHRPIHQYQGDLLRSTNYTGPMKQDLANGTIGNGFNGRHGGQPAQKKQKIDRNAPRDLPGDPIAVSDDDEVLKVTSVNGRPPPEKKQLARTQKTDGKAQPAPFEGTEYKLSYELPAMQQQRERKRRRGGKEPSQTPSTQAPSSQGANGIPTHEVVDLDDDSLQEITSQQARKSVPPQDLPLPPVEDLSKDLDKPRQSKQRTQRQSGDSVEFVSAQAMTQKQRSSINGIHGHPARVEANQPKRRRISQGRSNVTEDYFRDRELRRSVDTGQGEQRLNDKFSRVDAEPPQREANPRPTQREKMKATSGRRLSPVGESFSSGDELAGPTTVGSVSPEKRQGTPGLVQTKNDRPRSATPSDLQPTQFCQNPQPRQNRPSNTARQLEADEDYNDRLEIPLAEFFATSCVLTKECGLITLRWDDRHKEFDVYRDRELQVVKDGLTDVHIGRTEIDHVFHGPESPYFYIRGSKSLNGVSNGHICFQLEDVDDKAWLLARIIEVTGDRYHLQRKPDEEMEKYFQVQSRDISRGFQKRNRSGDMDSGFASQAAGRRHTAQQFEDNDEIKYEIDESRKFTRRRDMRGEEIVDTAANVSQRRSSSAAEQSRYFLGNAPRRTTRQTKPVHRSISPPPPARWTQVNKPERWAHSVVYPSEGARRVTVDFQDLERLDEGEFLNDNVISFALRRIEENMAPEHKEKVHFFNSFFYTALTAGKTAKRPINYETVRKWTKSKDLLGCDYVVVPINLDFHWFVAIICNLPNLPRRIDGFEDDDKATEDQNNAKEQDQQDPPDAASSKRATEGEATTRLTPDTRKLSISDEEEEEASRAEPDRRQQPPNATKTHAPDETELQSADKKPALAAGRKAKRRGPPSYDPEKPAIITMDSFGITRGAEIRNLKDYIKCEAAEKREMAVDTSQLQGMNAKDGIPIQTNFFDCGIYLVGYLEQFAKDPRAFVTKALKRQMDKAEFAKFDPSKKRDEIREELLRLQKEQDSEHKARKATKKAAKTDDQADGSTAAASKAESKPASKAVSPAETGSTAPQQESKPKQVSPSRAPRESTESATHAQDDQDKDLQFEVPRALKDDAGRSSAYARLPGPIAEDSGSDEMLDDSRTGHMNEKQVVIEGIEPNPLLDNLSETLQRRSQQLNSETSEQVHDLRGQARRAAKQRPPEKTASADGEDEGDPEEWGGIPDDEETQDAKPAPGALDQADQSNEAIVVDLSDDDEGLDNGVRPAEIPDSQEQRARAWTRKQMIFEGDA